MSSKTKVVLAVANVLTCPDNNMMYVAVTNTMNAENIFSFCGRFGIIELGRALTKALGNQFNFLMFTHDLPENQFINLCEAVDYVERDCIHGYIEMNLNSGTEERPVMLAEASNVNIAPQFNLQRQRWEWVVTGFRGYEVINGRCNDDESFFLRTYSTTAEGLVAVNLVAAGYEWVCPFCGEDNTEIETSDDLMCRGCKAELTSNDVINCSHH